MVSESYFYHYYQKRTPKDQVAKLYKREGLKGKETLIFDPQTIKGEAKDVFKISSFSPNKSGKLIAVNISLLRSLKNSYPFSLV